MRKHPTLTLTKWNKLLKNLDLSKLPIKVKISCDMDKKWQPELYFCMFVPDVDSKAKRKPKVEIGFTVGSFNLQYVKNELQALRYIQSKIHTLLNHEIDEQFLYKKKRIFDPHKHD